MEGGKNQPPEVDFKATISNTLDLIARVDETEETVYVAMPRGMQKVTSETAKKIGTELQRIWGQRYPELFIEEADDE